MSDENDTRSKSNLSASVAAMSQRLKAARQQQLIPSPPPAAAADCLILSGRSHSPTPPPDRSHSPTPHLVSVKAAQADLELKIKELEVTSMTDRIRESESRLTGVTSENNKLRNINEQLELKLIRLMERSEDDLKERQLQWEDESGKIVKEFQMENQQLRREVDNIYEEMDATKSVLSLLQEDYRVAGEVVDRLRGELEEERQSHVETQRTVTRLTAAMKHLEREKGAVLEELEMIKSQLQMSQGGYGDVQSEYEKLQLEKLSLQKKYFDLQQEMESNDAENGNIQSYKAQITSLQRELRGVREKDDVINDLRNELESARSAHEQEMFTLQTTVDNLRAQLGASEDDEFVGKVVTSSERINLIRDYAVNRTSTPPSFSRQQSSRSDPPRPVIFLDIDGVLNITKHNKQILFEDNHLRRLKNIIEETNALIVLSTFWRHFHEYITYVFHRHGIDVASCMLPPHIGSTRGKQCTRKFLHHHRLKQKQNHSSAAAEESMLDRTAEDEAEYSSRAEEIEAWLKMYGTSYLGGGGENGNRDETAVAGYEWHAEDWKYVILDDRPTAAKPDTPLFKRFVQTVTDVGLSEDDADWAIEILMSGPRNVQTRPSFRRKPSSGVRSLDEIFSHSPCRISSSLAELLTPDSLSRQQVAFVRNNNIDDSLKSSQCPFESEILAAMCDYDNISPSLVALLQPPTMDGGIDEYNPAMSMMKKFEEEKKLSASFEEGEVHDVEEEKKECNNLLEAAESCDSLDKQPVSASPPPMTIFKKSAPSFSEHADDSDSEHTIGLDDLSPRWNKRPQLPFAKDDDADE